MISVEEARQLIASHLQALGPRSFATEEALGLTLAEDVVSDIDSPPHDKSMMDGFAVRAADSSDEGYRLRILEQVTAGEIPSQIVGDGQATQIMTGAPVPDGCDAVVMVERSQIEDNGEYVRIDGPALKSGQNILRRATSLKNGEVVIKRGHFIRAIEIGLMLEVGQTNINAVPRPRVAVISTGNELVPAGQRPALGQIRNSNGPMLEAQVRQAGGEVVSLGIGRDNPAALADLMRRGIDEADVLVLSGGVSAGVLDLVPQALTEVGVQEVFHKVRLKPGKPLWFGTYDAQPQRRDAQPQRRDAQPQRRDAQPQRRLVFGLPGNPNSSLVCFELFVRPAMAMLAGRTDPGLVEQQALLGENHYHRGDRPTYFPARHYQQDGQLQVRPLAWKGSADQRTLSQANCLLCLVPGERQYQAGDAVTILRL